MLANETLEKLASNNKYKITERNYKLPYRTYYIIPLYKIWPTIPSVSLLTTKYLQKSNLRTKWNLITTKVWDPLHGCWCCWWPIVYGGVFYIYEDVWHTSDWKRLLSVVDILLMNIGYEY